jgi:aspartate kinase
VIVLKFGGSSVADAERLRQVADLAVAALPKQPAIVLSAMGKTTDALFAAANAAQAGRLDVALDCVAGVFARGRAAAAELLAADAAAATSCAAGLAEQQAELLVVLRSVALLRELTPRTRDTIVAHGERIATTVLTALLASRGLPVQHCDARQWLRTDASFGAANPDRPAIRRLVDAQLRPHLAAGSMVVTQGYVGATAEGATTTLGRGGSDWTAALLGEALGAAEVQIWTDVEGVLTADPRQVPQARPIARLSPAEAAELAAFGAKVLHPATMQPAVDARIPVTVRHTQRPRGAFTTIDPRSTPVLRHGIAALACRGPVTVLTMTSTRMLAQSGYLARLFGAFGELGICVDLVVTAEVAVACTVEPDAPLERLVQALQGLARVDINTDRAIVCAVGEGLCRTPGIVERACRALGDITPELLGAGGNERNLSFVVRQDQVTLAMQRLHAEFFPATAARSPTSSAVAASAEESA